MGGAGAAERDVLLHRHVPEERVVLEDEADLAILHARVGRVDAFLQSIQQWNHQWICRGRQRRRSAGRHRYSDK